MNSKDEREEQNKTVLMTMTLFMNYFDSRLLKSGTKTFVCG